MNRKAGNIGANLKYCLSAAACICLFSSISYAAEIKVTASSSENDAFGPEYVLDGNTATRWGSKFSDNEWLEIDLGESKEISGLTLFWQTAYASSYEVLLSDDGKDWKSVYKQDKGAGGNEEIYFDKAAARYIKLVFGKRATEWGYSLFEVSVNGAGINDPGRINTADIIPLEGEWDFRTDASKDWAKIETGRLWEDQGFPDYDGYAWYKKDVPIPENWDDGKAVLMIGGVDDAYELYVNGQFVAGYGPRAKDSTIHGSVNQTLTVTPVGKYLVPGKPNDFTFRVFDEWGGGGISKPPIVLVQDGDAVPQIRKRLDAQSYYQMKAKPSERKYYPEWIGGRQAYWTVVGVEGDIAESCFCEDGQIQMYNWGPSLMPFIYMDGKLLTREDFRISQSLEKGYLPMPEVVWENDGLAFSQKLFGYGKQGEAITCIRYKLKNKSEKKLEGKLFLTIRPFQVYPSWQWSGGMAMIRSLEYDAKGGHTLKIDGKDRLVSLTVPDKFGGSTYMEDTLIDDLKAGTITPRRSVSDPFDYASGALEYGFSIAPKAEKEYLFIIPLHGGKPRSKNFDAMQEKTRRSWEEKLNKVRINIPDKEMSDAVKTSLAYILINKNGPMLQGGSGAYKKSWIRDACSASAAMMRMGHTAEAKEYLDWFTGHIKPDGKVPPIMISEAAAEPAWEREFEEYDSQGQYVYAVLEYYRFSGDKAWLKGKLPAVKRVLDFMEALRKEEPSGIFPRSVSHEGYFPAPGMHSYWDDFWGIRGWKDAGEIAAILGDSELSARAEKEAADFRKSVYDSIKAVRESAKIKYIPGCVEKADFDAPSTAIAVWPTEESQFLPQDSLYNTFGIFWTDQFAPSLAAGPQWSYSPYAIRIAQVFVLLDQREKAVRMMEEYLRLHRPLAWNGWAEGILADDRKPWFVGDLPHTWVASIYINAFRSLFVYEKDGRLILGHGIPRKWLLGKEGVSIGNFPTYYGTLSYSIKEEKGGLRIKVSGKARPPEGFVFILPYGVGGQIEFKKLPADITVPLK